MNFNRLRALINEMETKPYEEQQSFYEKLYNICKIEMNIRQSNLQEWFNGGV